MQIRPETQQRVLDAARELGYRANALARSVRTGKSGMIGYVVDDVHYEPYWHTLVGAMAEAEKEGFTLKVLTATGETFMERIRQCMELRLEGLLLRLVLDKRPLFEEANRAGIAVVMVDDWVAQPYGTRVSADDRAGCNEAISHLAELGHRKIAFISTGFESQPMEGVFHREGLYLKEMAARGFVVPDGYISRERMHVYGRGLRAEHNDASGLAAADALLDHPAGRPTAIFCWRDEAALVAIQACQRRGLRVPDDISIVGFSDLSAAWLSSPPLTTCMSPWEEMGQLAMRELVRSLKEGFDPSPRVIQIPSGLIIRESTGRVPV
jgi:DNA-binding LacI/PurR family transcriptional regulator